MYSNFETLVALLESLELEERYRIICEEAKKIVKAVYSSLFVFHNGTFQRIYSTSPVLYDITPNPNGKTSKAFYQNKPYISGRTKLIKEHHEFKDLSVGSDLCIPLIYNNNNIGTLSLLSPLHKVFGKHDINLLSPFVPLATLSIRNAQLKKDLASALDQRNRFISVAAHELRTPLSAIYAYIQILSQIAQTDKWRGQQYIEKADHESRRLIKLVNDFVQVNNMNMNKTSFDLKQCNLINIMDMAVDEFKCSHPDFNIMFKNNALSGNAPISADSDKLMEVFTNIFNNSAKYSPKGSTIMCDIEHMDSEYLIHIADHGLGITKEDLPNIYNLFYKGRQAHKEGMGIGLFLVKNIISRHHGNISIDSEINQGTTVTISLPQYKLMHD